MNYRHHRHIVGGVILLITLFDWQSGVPYPHSRTVLKVVETV